MERRRFLKGLLALPVVAPLVKLNADEEELSEVEEQEFVEVVETDPAVKYEWKVIGTGLLSSTQTITTNSTLPVVFAADGTLYQLKEA